MSITTAPQSGGMPSGQIYGAGVPQPSISPVGEALFKVADTYLQTQTNKKIAQRNLEGQIAGQTREGLDRVRSQETFLNQIFGKSATLQGAEQAFATAAITDKFNDLHGRLQTDQLFAKKPEEFNKIVQKELEPFLATGDAGLDSLMLQNTYDLQNKLFNNYSKMHHEYEQELYIQGVTADTLAKVESAKNSEDLTNLAQFYYKTANSGEVGRDILVSQVIGELQRGETTSYMAIKGLFEDTNNPLKLTIPQRNNILNQVQNLGNRAGSGTETFNQELDRKVQVQEIERMLQNPDVPLQDVIQGYNILLEQETFEGRFDLNKFQSSVTNLLAGTYGDRLDYDRERNELQAWEGLTRLTSRANTTVEEVLNYIGSNKTIMGTLNGRLKAEAEVIKFANTKSEQERRVIEQRLINSTQDHAKAGNQKYVEGYLGLLQGLMTPEEFNNFNANMRVTADESQKNEIRIKATEDLSNFLNQYMSVEEIEAVAPALRERFFLEYSGVPDPILESLFQEEIEKNLERVSQNDNTVTQVQIRELENGVNDGYVLADVLEERLFEHFYNTGKYNEASMVRLTQLQRRQEIFQMALETSDTSMIPPKDVEAFTNYVRTVEGNSPETIASYINRSPVSSETRTRNSNIFSGSNFIDPDGNPTTAAIQEIDRLFYLSQQGGDVSFALRQVEGSAKEIVAQTLNLMEIGLNPEGALLAVDKINKEVKVHTTVLGLFGNDSKEANNQIDEVVKARVKSAKLQGLENTPGYNAIRNLVVDEYNKYAVQGKPVSSGFFIGDNRAVRNIINSNVADRMVDGIIGYTIEDKGQGTKNSRDLLSRFLENNNQSPLGKKDTVVYDNDRFLIYRYEQGNTAFLSISKYDVNKFSVEDDVVSLRKEGFLTTPVSSPLLSIM